MHTAADPLLHALDVAADATALVDGDQRWTYRRLAGHAASLATAASALGARPGDRVGYLGGTSATFVAAHLGVPAGRDPRPSTPSTPGSIRTTRRRSSTRVVPPDGRRVSR